LHQQEAVEKENIKNLEQQFKNMIDHINGDIGMHDDNNQEKEEVKRELQEAIDKEMIIPSILPNEESDENEEDSP